MKPKKYLSTKDLIIRSITAIGFIVVMLLLAYTICVCNSTIAYADTMEYGGGSGTVESPYIISTDEHMQRLSANVQGGGVNGYEGVYFSLENDIDLTNISQGVLSGWMPIGTSLYPFAGTFLGNNRKITGLIINRVSDNIGLFGVTGQNAVIKDLTVDGTIRGGMYTGGIVGYNSGRIENTVNLANISTMSAGSSDTGGIVGHNFKGVLVGNVNYGNITNTSFNVGGVAGTNDGTMLQCFNVGEINGNSNIGGIAGVNSRDGQISEVFNNGKIIASNNFVGGIVGDNKGLITNTYNAGSITASVASDYFGGLAGNNDGTNGSNGYISKSYNIGNIDKVSFFGHISAFNTGTIENCYFNNEDNYGDAANGIYAVNTVGLKNKAMLDVDTLTNKDKMILLSTDKSIWTRRNYDDDYVYYPELSAFISKEESKDSVRFKRVEKSYDDVSLGETEFTYNGETHEINILVDNVSLVKDLEYNIISNSINANGINGSSITIDLTNYYKGTITKEFTIHQREITISWSYEKFYYNGRVQHHTAKVNTGRVGDDDITFTYEYDSNINAGIHTISAKLANTEINRNYVLKPNIHEYEIYKSKIDVTWENPKFIYNGQVQHPVVIIKSGVVDGEEIVFTYEFIGCVNAGEYNVKATLADNSINANYMIEPCAREFNIEPKKLTVQWDETKLFYNGQAQHPTATVDGVVNDDSVTLVYTEYENNINVKNGYIVKLSLADTLVNSNYVLQSDVEKQYSIFASKIEIEWTEEVLRYNAKPQRPTFVVCGQVENEEIEFEISDYSQNINCGTNYSITIQLIDNSINSNYIFESCAKLYNIEKAQVVVSWESEPLYYNGTVQHPKAKIMSPVFDEVNLIYSNYNGCDAFKGYSINIDIDNTNYEITNTLTYDILPKILQIKWDSNSLEYNATCQYPNYCIVGVLDNETVDEIISDYSSHIIPGEYTVVLTCNNSNYIFDDTDICKYIITKREIRIDNIIAMDRCYDETVFVELTGGVLTGIIEGEDVSFIMEQGVMQDANVGKNKEVKVNIVLTGNDANYYILREPTVSVNISKAVIDMSCVSFDSQTFTYDGTAKSVFINGELHKCLDVEYENNAVTLVGMHNVIANFILLDNNYEPVSSINTTLYIVESKYSFETVDIEIEEGYVQYGSAFSINNISEENCMMDLEGLKFQKGFSIDLILNDVVIKPDGILKIKISLPTKILNNQSLKVYSVNKEEIQDIDFSVEDGKLVFYTTELGSFVIVTNRSYAWVAAIVIPIILVLLVLIIVLICVCRKRKLIAEQEILSSVNVTVDNNQQDNLACENLEECSADSEIEFNKNKEFIYDGVYCKDFSYFMNSLSFRTAEKQMLVCSGNDDIAKLYESKPRNVVYWKGRKIRIYSEEYKEFMSAVMEAIKNA